MKVLDRLGWPVEKIKGRPVVNFIRQVIHGRSIISDAEYKRRDVAKNFDQASGWGGGGSIGATIMPTGLPGHGHAIGGNGGSAPTYRPTPKRLIVGRVSIGYATDIRDGEGNHIADIRGWGRMQYYKDGAELQDKVAQFVCDAINEKLANNPI